MNIIKRKPKTNLQKKRNTVINHWILQKVSAFVLIPLVIWFLFVFKDFLYNNYNNKVLWFKSFSNSLLLSIFLLVAIFHLRLGLTVVIEDYIHNFKRKKILLGFLEILYLFLAVITVIIVLILYTG
ncbi:succinate dehydrogenase, hydrophobic membrane anchor protein [Alphaproteobacteria bacterium]|nr:succinate dehydrogenase, hydrophobic membrane anchor protein [Alphaproteobacteria bacterium]